MTKPKYYRKEKTIKLAHINNETYNNTAGIKKTHSIDK